MVKRCSAQGWCLKDSDFLSPASRAGILVKNPRAYARGYYLPPLRGSLMLIPYEHLGMGKKIKVDMSAAAVTARLKRACGLGDAERRATMIRNLTAEIKSESRPSKRLRNKKKNKDASIHS